jgi:DNA-binding transcriptional MocR family regulator
VSQESFSLARGIPSPDLLPVAGLRAAADRALKHPADVLLYGDAAGLEPLRAWFAERTGAPVDRVILTNGSLHGLGMLGAILHPERDWIAVEAPTYDFGLETVRRTGCRIVALDRDAELLDLDALEHEIAQAGPPRLAYVLPTFQNPSGGTLASATRARLVELAREHDFPVVEDDPYRDIAFRGPVPPAMRDAAPGQVVLMTSLSKTVAPGMRVGALVIPERHVAAVRDLASHTYVAPGRFSHGVAFAFCDSPDYAAHLGSVVNTLGARARGLTDALNEALETSYQAPDGGYFLWISAPGGDAGRAAARAAEHGVVVQPGTSFFPDDRGNRFLRLSFAGIAADAMPTIASRLRRAWAPLLAGRTR